MKDEDSDPGCEHQSRYDANRAERHGGSRCNSYDYLGKRRELRLAEPIDSNNENPHDRGSQAIESATHDWCCTQVRIGERKREHNAKGGNHETKSRKQSAPQASTHISEEHAELRHSGSGNQVGKAKFLRRNVLWKFT